jgi:hypothetical protein
MYFFVMIIYWPLIFLYYKIICFEHIQQVSFVCQAYLIYFIFYILVPWMDYFHDALDCLE